MMNHIERTFKRVQNAIRVGMLAANSNETTSTANMQIQKSAMELHTHDHVQNYGFASAPLAGAAAVILSVAGNQSNGIVVGTHDPRYRPVGLGAGDTAIHDTTQKVHLTNNAKIDVMGQTEINFFIAGNFVGKWSSAGLAVMGNITATGDIIAGTISQMHHDHSGVQPGDGVSGPPVP